MQEPTQQPAPRKTIHIGYVIPAIIIIIVAIVCAVVFGSSGPGPVTPTPTPTVSPTLTPTPTPITKVTVSIVAPATVVKSAGKDFHVFVNISAVSNLAGAQYDIQYDPKVITYIDATAGNINGITIPIQSKDYFPVSKPGVVRIIQIDTSLSGINGEGYLVDLHFRVEGKPGATSAISFIEPTDSNGARALVDVAAQEIPATWENASVTIQ